MSEYSSISTSLFSEKTPSPPTDQHRTDSAMDAERSSDYARSHSIEERKTTPMHRHKKLKLKRRHNNDNKENIAQKQLKEKQQQQSGKGSGCTNITDEHGRDYAENCVKTEAENETDSDLKLVENAYQYITDKTYPPGSTKNEKRSIRRKAEKLVVVKGELLYRKKDGNEVGNPRRW